MAGGIKTRRCAKALQSRALARTSPWVETGRPRQAGLGQKQPDNRLQMVGSSMAHRDRRKPVLKKIVIWLIALVSLPCVAAPIAPGNYDGFLIGVDRNGVLTGYFESSTGAGQFSCIFFVSGKMTGSVNRVQTWFPSNRKSKEVIHGVLEHVFSNGQPAIRLKLDEEHGGCWNVQTFATDPSTFVLAEQGRWESIRIIASKKAYFYENPSSPKPRKAYAVTGNALRVIETRDGWVRGEYVSPENRRTRGWISERDLFSATNPATAKKAAKQR